MMRVVLVSLAACLLPATLFAGPRVEIIVGEKAAQPEQQAAAIVSSGLQRLYDAEATIVTRPSGTLPAIFLGSPTTNKSLEFFSASWPKLSAQGHFVRSTTYRGQPALVIGADSPRAACWAGAEYLHALGMRPMLYGDLAPIAPPAFSLAGFALKCEPGNTIRAWQLGGNSPVSTISWERRDLPLLIGQLARLKFTQIVVQVDVDQPFVPLADRLNKFRLWDAPPLIVNGDTAGRSAFQGAQLFENPNFAARQTNEEQLAAGQAWLQQVIQVAHQHGMTVAVRLEHAQHVDAQAAAYERAFPQLDQIYYPSGKLYLPRLSSSDNKLLNLRVGLRKLADEGEGQLAAAETNMSVLLPLTGQPAGILPQTSPAAVEVAQQLLARLELGYVAASLSPADLDFAAYYLSRIASGNKLTLAQACDRLLTPVCGEEVHTRVSQAMQLIDQAASSIELNEPELAVAGPAMALKHYDAGAEAPAWWGQVREAYLNAMNEMYRANTRAREGSRSYTLYLARRYEFGFEYMNCLQALRNAGIARKKGDKEAQLAELEKAIDSINNACNALAAVARSNSDRGTIAVLNAYVYRPLVKELEKADAE